MFRVNHVTGKEGVLNLLVEGGGAAVAQLRESDVRFSVPLVPDVPHIMLGTEHEPWGGAILREDAGVVLAVSGEHATAATVLRADASDGGSVVLSGVPGPRESVTVASVGQGDVRMRSDNTVHLLGGDGVVLESSGSGGVSLVSAQGTVSVASVMGDVQVSASSVTLGAEHDVVLTSASETGVVRVMNTPLEVQTVVGPFGGIVRAPQGLGELPLLPTAPSDAASKNYVDIRFNDAISSSIDIGQTIAEIRVRPGAGLVAENDGLLGEDHELVLNLGTPGTLSSTTTNFSSSDSHTHAIHTVPVSSTMPGIVRTTGATRIPGEFFSAAATAPVSTAILKYDGFLFASRLHEGNTRLADLYVPRTATVSSSDASIAVSGGFGTGVAPNVNLTIAENGIRTEMIADSSVTGSKLFPRIIRMSHLSTEVASRVQPPPLPEAHFRVGGMAGAADDVVSLSGDVRMDFTGNVNIEDMRVLNRHLANGSVTDEKIRADTRIRLSKLERLPAGNRLLMSGAQGQITEMPFPADIVSALDFVKLEGGVLFMDTPMHFGSSAALRWDPAALSLGVGLSQFDAPQSRLHVAGDVRLTGSVVNSQGHEIYVRVADLESIVMPWIQAHTPEAVLPPPDGSGGNDTADGGAGGGESTSGGSGEGEQGPSAAFLVEIVPGAGLTAVSTESGDVRTWFLGVQNITNALIDNNAGIALDKLAPISGPDAVLVSMNGWITASPLPAAKLGLLSSYAPQVGRLVYSASLDTLDSVDGMMWSESTSTLEVGSAAQPAASLLVHGRLELNGAHVADVNSSLRAHSSSGGGMITWDANFFHIRWSEPLHIVSFSKTVNPMTTGWVSVPFPSIGDWVERLGVAQSSVQVNSSGVSLNPWESLWHYDASADPMNTSLLSGLYILSRDLSMVRLERGWTPLAFHHGTPTSRHLKWLPAALIIPCTPGIHTYNTATAVASWVVGGDGGGGGGGDGGGGGEGSSSPPPITGILEFSGSGRDGEVLFATAEGQAGYSERLRLVLEASAVHVSAGGDFTVATLSDGRVSGAGNNAFGQVGLASAQEFFSEFTPGTVLQDVIMVAAGHRHAFALDSARRIFGFGENAFGELGLGPEAGASVRIPTAVQALSRVMHVACGESHSVVITEAGDVLTAGTNASGQLGRELSPGQTSADAFGHVSAMAAVAGGAHCISVSCGKHHSAVLLSDGRLVVFGQNARGQLGVGDFSTRFFPVIVPGVSDAAFVACGGDNTGFLTATGAARLAGENVRGQLGINPNVTIASPTFVSLSGPWSRIAWAWDFAVLVQEGGGITVIGQTDVTNPTPQPTPAEVYAVQDYDGDGVVHVSAGEHHAVFITGRRLVYGIGMAEGFGGVATTHHAIPVLLDIREERSEVRADATIWERGRRVAREDVAMGHVGMFGGGVVSVTRTSSADPDAPTWLSWTGAVQVAVAPQRAAYNTLTIPPALAGLELRRYTATTASDQAFQNAFVSAQGVEMRPGQSLWYEVEDAASPPHGWFAVVDPSNVAWAQQDGAKTTRFMLASFAQVEDTSRSGQVHDAMKWVPGGVTFPSTRMPSPHPAHAYDTVSGSRNWERPALSYPEEAGKVVVVDDEGRVVASDVESSVLNVLTSLRDTATAGDAEGRVLFVQGGQFTANSLLTFAGGQLDVEGVIREQGRALQDARTAAAQAMLSGGGVVTVTHLESGASHLRWSQPVRVFQVQTPEQLQWAIPMPEVGGSVVRGAEIVGVTEEGIPMMAGDALWYDVVGASLFLVHTISASSPPAPGSVLLAVRETATRVIRVAPAEMTAFPASVGVHTFNIPAGVKSWVLPSFGARTLDGTLTLTGPVPGTNDLQAATVGYVKTHVNDVIGDVELFPYGFQADHRFFHTLDSDRLFVGFGQVTAQMMASAQATDVSLTTLNMAAQALSLSSLAEDRVLVSGAGGGVHASQVPTSRLGWIDSPAFLTPGAIVFSQGAGHPWHSSAGLVWDAAQGRLQVQGRVEAEGTITVGGRRLMTAAQMFAHSAMVGGGVVTWRYPEAAIRWDSPIFAPLKGFHVPAVGTSAVSFRRVMSDGSVQLEVTSTTPAFIPLGVSQTLWFDGEMFAVVDNESVEAGPDWIMIASRGVDALMWLPAAVQFPGNTPGEFVYDTPTAKASWLALTVAQGGRVVVSDTVNPGEVISSSVPAARLAYINVPPEDAVSDGVFVSSGPNEPMQSSSDLTYDRLNNVLRVTGEVRIVNAAGDRHAAWTMQSSNLVLSLDDAALLSVPPSRRLGVGTTSPEAAMHVHAPLATASLPFLLTSNQSSTRLAVHTSDQWLEFGNDGRARLGLQNAVRLEVDERTLSLIPGALSPGDVMPHENTVRFRASASSTDAQETRVGIRGWEGQLGAGTFFVRHGAQQHALTIESSGRVGVGVASARSSLSIAGGATVGSASFAAARATFAGELAVQSRIYVGATLDPSAQLPSEPFSLYAEDDVHVPTAHVRGDVVVQHAVRSASAEEQRIVVSTQNVGDGTVELTSSDVSSDRLHLIDNAHPWSGAVVFSGGEGVPLQSDEALMWTGADVSVLGETLDRSAMRTDAFGMVGGGRVVAARAEEGGMLLVRWSEMVSLPLRGETLVPPDEPLTHVRALGFSSEGHDALEDVHLTAYRDALWLALGGSDLVFLHSPDDAPEPEEPASSQFVMPNVLVVRGTGRPAGWRPRSGWVLIAAVDGAAGLKWIPAGGVCFPRVPDEAGASWTYETDTGRASWASRGVVSDADRVLVSDGEGGVIPSLLSTDRLVMLDVSEPSFEIGKIVVSGGPSAPLEIADGLDLVRDAAHGLFEGLRVHGDVEASGGVLRLASAAGPVSLSQGPSRSLVIDAQGGVAFSSGLSVSEDGDVSCRNVVSSTLSAGTVLTAGAGGVLQSSSVDANRLHRLTFAHQPHHFLMCGSGEDDVVPSVGKVSWVPGEDEIVVESQLSVGVLRPQALDLSLYASEEDRADGRVLQLRDGRVVASPLDAALLSSLARSFPETARQKLLYMGEDDVIREAESIVYDANEGFVKILDSFVVVGNGCLSVTNSTDMPPITTVTYDGVPRPAGLMIHSEDQDMIAMRKITGTTTSLGLVRMRRWDAGVSESRSRMDFCLGHGDLNVADTLREVLTVRSDRRVGINTTSPEAALHVVGDIHATGGVTQLSDARIKTDVRRIDNALDRLCRLSGYTFRVDGMLRRETGVIAQEVQDVIEEAVTVRCDGLLSVAYGNLAGIIVEAIKELREQVRDLKQALRASGSRADDDAGLL